MDLKNFICNALAYCNPLNFDFPKSIEQARKEIEKKHSKTNNNPDAAADSDLNLQKN